MESKMNKVLDSIKDELKKDIPQFRAGDTVSVGVRVIEGEKSRIQLFKGVVIAISYVTPQSSTSPSSHGELEQFEVS